MDSKNANIPPKPTKAGGSSKDLISFVNPEVNLDKNNPLAKTSTQLRSDIPKSS
jgi:hypothetical protein